MEELKINIGSLMMPIFEQFLSQLMDQTNEKKKGLMSDDTQLTIELLSEPKHPNARPKVAPIGQI